MLTRVDTEANDGPLAKRPGRFKAVQSFDQYEALAVGSHQNWGVLAAIKHAGGNFIDTRLFERGAAFDRHINIRDRKGLALHHFLNIAWKRRLVRADAPRLARGKTNAFSIGRADTARGLQHFSVEADCMHRAWRLLRERLSGKIPRTLEAANYLAAGLAIGAAA